MASSYPAHLSSRPPAVPRVLSIAGTDPSGGAGTAADLKSITAAGGYGMSVVTALVAQNTHGVRAIHTPPADFLSAQLRAVSDDVTLDAVKTGMLATAETIAAVAAWLDELSPAVLVVDPVMVATSGDRLLQPDAEQAMVEFCRRATVVTPNIHELAVLTGEDVAPDEEAALAQARRWSTRTGVAVVVKTGHLTSRRVTNTWVDADGACLPVESTRLDTDATHGTGCSLAAALATRLGRGDTPEAALTWATDWLHESIAHGADLQVGTGHGPVDHAHRSRRLQAAGLATPWLDLDTVPAALQDPAQLAAVTVGARGAEELPAAVPAAGPWTAALWSAGASITREIAECDFVTALVDGSLSDRSFAFYLAQDALYLGQYARALAALAARSEGLEAQVFWAEAAAGCLKDEAELHRTWLGDGLDVAIGPVTRAYTDFLVATALGQDRVVGVAAVLPCFWLYAQTGATLPEVAEEHPYAAWLGTYGDPAFVTGTQQALAQVEREFELASPTARAEAARAYLTACRHELEFFDQGLRIEPGQ